MGMKIAKVLIFIVIGVVLAACAHQPVASTPDAPGFLYGLLHGFISPFSLIASIFGDVRVYAIPNNGGWYDFGFVVGCAMIFGGSGARAFEFKFTKSTS
ncbi:MAG: hypothetical protein GC182_11250 [Rhodopseudomonas sp.]|nr:hypothetical protein [Rhodopseudomonas sp.]